MTRIGVASSVGFMNLVGCVFMAMPVCHGAGGLAGQYRFGARSGSSVVALGVGKIVLACAMGAGSAALLGAFPNAILGVMLAFAGVRRG